MVSQIDPSELQLNKANASEIVNFPFLDDDVPRSTSSQGGTLNCSAYVGSDPASTLHRPKISGISSTPKKYLKF